MAARNGSDTAVRFRRPSLTADWPTSMSQAMGILGCSPAILEGHHGAVLYQVFLHHHRRWFGAVSGRDTIGIPLGKTTFSLLQLVEPAGSSDVIRHVSLSVRVLETA